VLGIFKEFLDEIRFGNGLAKFGRYYGLYRGKVMGTVDSTNMGKIAVNVPEITQDPTKSLANMAFPLHPVMADFPPEVGDTVWVLFEDGRPEFPVWVGHWWTKQGTGMARPSDLNPASGQRPTKRFFATKSGHRLVFDDDAGNETVELLHKSGARVFIDPTGKVEILTPTSGLEISLNGQGLPFPPEELVRKTAMSGGPGHTHMSSQGPTSGPLGPMGSGPAELSPGFITTATKGN